MPLGQGIGELWEAVRDRVEVSGEAPTREVTAGSFDSALAYAREAYGDAAVIARRDRDRWWPRVTLVVTTDPGLAASAPPLTQLARPQVPEQQAPRSPRARHAAGGPRPRRPVVARPEEQAAPRGTLPSSLEAIFAHQEEQRMARQRTPEHEDSPGGR